ncbi:TIGR00296 family protein [Candidatus Bathyarchaeota archaeon]|nr:TIGR00296 family protein [Candidatus Bathyarchaeota archaeon]
MSFDLSLEEGQFLVTLARRAVNEYLKTGKRISVSKDVSEKFLQPCGVFVTISTMKNGEKELRGCIGYPYPTTPLAKAVIESAICSATEDPRFCPLSLDELDNVVFEVSVLTPPELIEVKKSSEYPSKIKVGKDGLIVEKGMFKGLLLPQVPVEYEWNEEEFLCQCCIKAYLPPDNWLIENTRIYKFKAIVFEEEKPEGEIRRKALGGK